VRRNLRFLLVVATTIAMSIAVARATQERQETFYDKLKSLFSRPTPTPKPHKKKKTTPKPTVSPKSSGSPSRTPASSPTEIPVAPVAPSAAQSAPTQAPTRREESKPQYFEPVRAITPGPRSRSRTRPKAVGETPTPPPTGTAIPEITVSTEETARSAMSLPPMMTASPPSAKTPTPSATPKPTPTPVAKKIEEPRPLLPTDQIAESASYPAQIRKIVDLGLYLAARHLTYKYASADPGKGGMDCSGFIYYVLTQSGIADAPRDAREQYAWVRKAGTFKAVLAQRDDTFELDELQPGDLLFWASNFGVSADPEIIQTMIYIGRDKTTNQRLMIGASERGTFKGQTKSGVSVFDLKVGRASLKPNKETTAVFVGYGHIPDLLAKQNHH
jgi:cell wall-associated NlpC family hydrolase